MVDIAQSSFGCSTNNATCFCCHPDFGYGIRDCANEACSSSDASSVIQYGVQYCASQSHSAPPCPGPRAPLADSFQAPSHLVLLAPPLPAPPARPPRKLLADLPFRWISLPDLHPAARPRPTL